LTPSLCNKVLGLGAYTIHAVHTCTQYTLYTLNRSSLCNTIHTVHTQSMVCTAACTSAPLGRLATWASTTAEFRRRGRSTVTSGACCHLGRVLEASVGRVLSLSISPLSLYLPPLSFSVSESTWECDLPMYPVVSRPQLRVMSALS
jgi:hypothetical protein